MKLTFSKWISRILILSMLISATYLPAYAEKASTPDISPWALSLLNEGERYGLYPVDWYYENFRATVPAAQLKTLLKNVQTKLAALNLEKNKTFKPVAIKKANTRLGVLTALYNEIGQYKLSGMGKMTTNPIAFLSQNQIVTGTAANMQLDKPCTTEQSVIFATKLIQKVYHAHNLGGEGFLWQVTKGDTTVYMLGSIHMANASIYPMDKGLHKAFASSKSLLVEANLLDMQNGMAYAQQQSVYSDSKRLKDDISPETYEKVKKAFAVFSIPEETFSTLKPWAASNTLSVLQMSSTTASPEAASSANSGIDLYFTTRAFIEGKSIVELEGLKFQTDLFNNLSTKLQESQLLQAAESVVNQTPQDSNEAKMLNAWLTDWQTGNVDSFTKSYYELSKDANDEMTKVLFGERDKQMAEKIALLLEEKGKNTYFVVVGAGHLAFKGSIVDLLNEKGYTVTLVDPDTIQ